MNTQTFPMHTVDTENTVCLCILYFDTSIGRIFSPDGKEGSYLEGQGDLVNRLRTHIVALALVIPLIKLLTTSPLTLQGASGESLISTIPFQDLPCILIGDI